MSIEYIEKRYEETLRELSRESNPGQIRAKKGRLVEFTAEEVCKIAWRNLGGDPQALKINKHKVPIEYEGDTYYISQDKHVFIDKEFVLSIECKSYTEVAMYKRILFDSYLLKSKYPDLSFVIIQLENWLGGDYASKISDFKGSPSVRVLNSFFPDLKILIITLLDGDRDINKPIHEPQFHKPLNIARLKHAILSIENIFRPNLIQARSLTSYR